MEKLLYQLLYGINFILYLLCIFLWLVLPNYITLNVSVCVFTLCLTLVLIIKRRDDVEKYLKSTQFKNLLQHSIHVFLIFCILGLVNYLVYKNPVQWDMTKEQTNRLNPQSIQLLEKIDHPVLFKVYSNRENARSLLPLLELYRLENYLLKVELIDPEVNPLKVKQDKITQYGQVKIEFQDRIVRFSEYSEKAITNALLRVLREQKTIIYFASGHRAGSIRDEGDKGLSLLKTYLESEGHTVQEVALASLGEQHQVLVFWGPKDGLLQQELDHLRRFLQRKGGLIMALDPQINFDPFGPLRNLIADERSITIANDFVVDALSALKESGGAIPVVEQFDSRHPITSGMAGQVFFPLVSSIQFLDPGGVELSSLAQTSEFPGSWAERDYDEVKKEKVSFTQGRDLMGPITIMGASESSAGKTLLVGNSTFVHNQYFNVQNNFMLFANAINWLADQGDFISFSRPKTEEQKLVLAAPTMSVLFYFSIVLAPLLLLTMAFLLYRRSIRL